MRFGKCAYSETPSLCAIEGPTTGHPASRAGAPQRSLHVAKTGWTACPATPQHTYSANAVVQVLDTRAIKQFVPPHQYAHESDLHDWKKHLFSGLRATRLVNAVQTTADSAAHARQKRCERSAGALSSRTAVPACQTVPAVRGSARSGQCPTPGTGGRLDHPKEGAELLAHM